ncbi:hypothetical protein OR1_03560 [Geobacter sp. OR-1]|uniref:Lcl C-terminal domain-containing protein n=1 Tax=Geobacter sp. OR-1 TaxID=1266765 RepID=UPI000542B87A|nr:DUF1566 domain-containing protein [Geobacter sp. OR-1]GAM11249.1 hypothetical protein OR1_03560 [Geobacter sp. OR-1]
MKSKYTFLAFLAVIATPVISSAAQTCRPADIAESTPASRFVINSDGTVADSSTGLIWKRCSEGLSGVKCEDGTVSTYNWKEAKKAAESSKFAGRQDWRLPTIKELDTIVEYQCSMPAVNQTVFPATPASNFWSSSFYSGYSNGGWNVNFNDGVRDSCSMNYSLYVRLVRSGK